MEGNKKIFGFKVSSDTQVLNNWAKQIYTLEVSLIWHVLSFFRFFLKPAVRGIVDNNTCTDVFSLSELQLLVFYGFVLNEVVIF